MVSISIGAELLIYHRNQILDNHIVERCAIELALLIHILARTWHERLLHITALHYHNHRLSLAFGNEIIHDVLHIALMAPARLVLSHSVLQIEHWIALVLIGFIFCRRINHGSAELALRCSIVRYRTNLTLCYSLLRTIVVAFGSLRNLQTTRLSAAAEIGFAGWIYYLYTIHIQEIIVEAYYQWVRNTIPVAIQILLHRILLSADVEDYLLCLRCMELDVGTAVFIHTRIVGIRNDTEQREHHVGITLTHGAIAFGDEMQSIATLRTSLGRDDVGSRDGLGDIIHNGDMLPAAAALVFLNGFAHEQRYIFCLQVQLFQNIVIHDLHTVRPVGIAIVGFTLMQQDTLDNALLLGNLGKFDESGVWIAVILGSEVLHPVGLLLQVRLTGTLVEEVDAGTAHRHGDGSHLDAVWQVIHHLSSEIIYRSKASVWSCLRRNGSMPLSFFPSSLFIIHGIHCHESWIHTCSVDVFDGGITLHIRLSET